MSGGMTKTQPEMPTPIRMPIDTPPAPGEVIEIASGVYWARLPLPMKLDHVNVFALADEDGWTLVDTGLDTRKTRDLWQELLDGPLAGRPVARVLVTHHHPDHIGLAGWFQRTHGAELLTTRTAWLTARMLILDEQTVPLPETLAFWRSAGMDPGLYAKRASERPFNFADVVSPLPLGFKRLTEGQTLHLAGRDWLVHMGHGHAPEHATLWDVSGALVIGGDQLLSMISPNLGVYATEPDADPVADWIESCTRLDRFATSDQLILPGHKLPFTGLPMRLQQMSENHHSALQRLRLHLATPRTAHECFQPLFKREIQSGEYGLALAEAVGHLNHLHHLGETTRTRRKDGAWLYQLKASAGAF